MKTVATHLRQTAADVAQKLRRSDGRSEAVTHAARKSGESHVAVAPGPTPGGAASTASFDTSSSTHCAPKGLGQCARTCVMTIDWGFAASRWQRPIGTVRYVTPLGFKPMVRGVNAEGLPALVPPEAIVIPSTDRVNAWQAWFTSWIDRVSRRVRPDARPSMTPTSNRPRRSYKRHLTCPTAMPYWTSAATAP